MRYTVNIIARANEILFGVVCKGQSMKFFTDDINEQHMQVMLLGHSDSYLKDKAMQVTIAFNHFGEGLIQRMPR